MRIAQVAPLYESVPPKRYGGTERIVSYLTEELVRRGHAVTLYATGDSETSASLVPGCASGLRLDGLPWDHNALLFPMLERVVREAGEYDVIHYHTDFYHFPLCRRHATPHLTTLHGRLDIPGLAELYAEYDDVPLVSISDAHRRPLPRARWLGTVHHGMPANDIPFQREADDYVLFLGRFSPEKGPDRAIEIARRTGVPLRMAGKIDGSDQDYFETVISPQLDDGCCTYVGECDDGEKQELIGRARALLFPIDWPEPFGMVLMESMAAGTPIIGFPFGSVPEVLSDPRSGRIVPDVPSAASALREVLELDRGEVREVFEERFTVERMVDDYLALYQDLIAGRQARVAAKAMQIRTTIVPPVVSVQ